MNRPVADEGLDVEAVVVGAGFAGLYALYKLREIGVSALGFEAAEALGGVWYWNAYPGARCDVESLDYSYSFDAALLDEWTWSERYATQPEILRYINHVADRFDLRGKITFGTRVTSCRFDDATSTWTVETNRGHRVRARFVIAAVGCLSTPKAPDIEGLKDFAGRWVQTSAWPREEISFAGKRVAVIGTGSSGIQSIPEIARDAARLTVFQRTPNFSVPACNGPIDPAYEAKVRADYVEHYRRNKQTRGGVQSRFTTGRSALDLTDAERRATFEACWEAGIGFGFQSLFTDLMTDQRANDTAAEFVRAKIRSIVEDPAVAERLTPRDHPFATKRICLDSHYFETFNRPNVELVDLRATPIERVTRDGLRTSDRDYPVDILVFATGFDAFTGSLIAMSIEGAGGRRLADAWADGPHTLLGLMVEGFPNLFTVNGPGSPSVLANMILAIEQHVDWITGCIAHMREQGHGRCEPEPGAQAGWVEEVRRAADRTLYPRARSWYMGDNISGKPRMLMAYVGGFADYATRCREIADAGYPGFVMSGG